MRDKHIGNAFRRANVMVYVGLCPRDGASPAPGGDAAATASHGEGSSASFGVATYHMPCAFDKPLVMLAHGGLAARHAAALADGAPFVLAGDFNMKPWDPAYRLVTEGRLSPEERRAFASAARPPPASNEDPAASACAPQSARTAEIPNSRAPDAAADERVPAAAADDGRPPRVDKDAERASGEPGDPRSDWVPEPTSGLRSCYRERQGREPDFTNFALVNSRSFRQRSPAAPFCETLDYIFVSEQWGPVLSVDPLPNRSDPAVVAAGPMPTETEPSDHLLIAADLVLP
jgi:endonuclease/exonuclease/phosphatase family metal-dependent hydrolase